MNRIQSWLKAIRDVRELHARIHGRPLRLFAPRSFSEKMQWRKLFDRNKLLSIYCDKLATRDLIASRIGAAYLAPLLWTGMPEEIPFDTLVPPYFLKSSHASGHFICITNAIAHQHAAIRDLGAAWLKVNFFDVAGETGYKNVPRRLLAEQALLNEAGGPPLERRLFVFDGRVRIINTVFVEAGKVRNGAFHTPDWEKRDWYFTRIPPYEFSKPKRLDDMIRIAEILGRGIDHVRVDIFDCGAQFFVGELTAYSWSGKSRFNPDEADFALGRFWRIRWPRLRAGLAILFADR